MTLTPKERSLIDSMIVNQNPEWDRTSLCFNFSRYLFPSVPPKKIISKSLLRAINDAEYGRPHKGRIDWVLALVRSLQITVNKGYSYNSCKGIHKRFNLFYSWLNQHKKSFALSEQYENYVAYSHYLSCEVKANNLSHTTRYNNLLALSLFIDTISKDFLSTNLKSNDNSAFLTLGVSPPKAKKSQYNKQILSNTESLAHALLGIYFALTDTVIYGEYPLSFRVHSKSISINLSQAKRFDELAETTKKFRQRKEKIIGRKLLSPSKNPNHDNRYAILNLKRNAFFLMFIIATGVNLSQALSLVRVDVKQIRVNNEQTIYKFKNRAGHIIQVTIYKEFKPLLADYLDWRDRVFVGKYESRWLFPSFLDHANFNDDLPVQFSPTSLKKVLKQLDVPWQSAQKLRKTAINWTHRYLDDNDSHLALEMAGHNIDTFYRSYHVPDHQRAITEASQFFMEFSPENLSVLNGRCEGEPKPIESIPAIITTPDCMLPSSCLFCVKHRDLDSFDYIWSLVSFRFLKHLEAAHGRLDPTDYNAEPVDLIINKITEKLNSFGRAVWLQKALDRVNQSDYHPHWVSAIDLLCEIGMGEK
ncbi:MAG: hypothetical protein WA981_15325 [Glaciecola sp.]